MEVLRAFFLVTLSTHSLTLPSLAQKIRHCLAFLIGLMFLYLTASQYISESGSKGEIKLYPRTRILKKHQKDEVTAADDDIEASAGSSNLLVMTTRTSPLKSTSRSKPRSSTGSRCVTMFRSRAALVGSLATLMDGSRFHSITLVITIAVLIRPLFALLPTILQLSPFL
jgi:hypothetical protein